MNNQLTASIIKRTCKDRQIAISKLLTDCNIRKSLIYDMEKRDWTPSAAIMEQIAQYLECSVDYLLGRDEQQKKPTLVFEDRLNEELIDRLCQLTPEELEKVDAFVQGILASR